jgi:hypothetical protein
MSLHRAQPEGVSSAVEVGDSSHRTTFPIFPHPQEPEISEGIQAARDAWYRALFGFEKCGGSPPTDSLFARTWPCGSVERVRLAAEIMETLRMYDG